MEQEIKTFVSALELEEYVIKMRVQHAKDYLMKGPRTVDLRRFSNADLLEIYDYLLDKEQVDKVKFLDEIADTIAGTP